MKPKYKYLIVANGILLTIIFSNTYIYYSLKNPPTNYVLGIIVFLLLLGTSVGVTKIIVRISKKDQQTN